MNDKERIVEERSFSKDSKEAYDRYCRQIDKEDNLMDQRLNWMLASQSLLFGAFGVSHQEIAELMYLIIPIVGIGASILVGISVRGAVASLKQYRGNLEEACPQKCDKEKHFPQLHRDPENLYLGLVSPKTLPWLFLGAWIVIIIWVLANSPV